MYSIAGNGGNGCWISNLVVVTFNTLQTEMYIVLYHGCNILTNQIAPLEVSIFQRHLLGGFFFYKTLFSEAIIALNSV